jgi:hypothetical protein
MCRLLGEILGEYPSPGVSSSYSGITGRPLAENVSTRYNATVNALRTLIICCHRVTTLRRNTLEPSRL